jgi:hypothetical protein
MADILREYLTNIYYNTSIS